jgi:hypothetical protein
MGGWSGGPRCVWVACVKVWSCLLFFSLASYVCSCVLLGELLHLLMVRRPPTLDEKAGAIFGGGGTGHGDGGLLGFDIGLTLSEGMLTPTTPSPRF